MSSRDVLDPSLVRLDVEPPSSFSALVELLGHILEGAGRLVDRDRYVADVGVREAQGSTYMGHGIGIPHAKSAGVGVASLCVLRLAEPMTYESHGETGLVDKVFAIAVPADAGNQHLKLLAKIARMLMNEAFLEGFRTADSADSVVHLIANRI